MNKGNVKQMVSKTVEGLAREGILKKYEGFVRLLSRQMMRRNGSYNLGDDLFSAGLVGLMDAFERFDTEKLTSFKTYAEFRVRGAMLDELRRQDWTPRTVRAQATRIQKTQDKLESKLGRRATDNEVGVALGLKQEQNARAFIDDHRAMNVISLDAFRAMPLEERVSTNPFEAVGARQLTQRVREVTSHLSPRQKECIELLYFAGLSNAEAARQMEVSESRVCQLHQEALGHLRRKEDVQALLSTLKDAA